ncbi:MAG TPA: Gmad2 immunoglobulin-like domain-containing protein [Gaiellaceae bacterium]|nr:Gmad2 immunoglobulin-like domain-containing protein [Gaiellaceae bacterium]
MTRVLGAAAAALVLLVAGCGGDDEGTTDTGTTTAPAETTDLRVYWLRDGKVWPALREIGQTDALAQAALDELLAGPTEQEGADLQFTTAIPEDVEGVVASIEDRVAAVELSVDLPDEPLAQVVYTLTQFVTVESVDIQGNTLTRADFEDLTPAILVESPLAFEDVTSPLRVTGTANTFEATFSYELTDTDGLIVDENFVTATSGTGTRGTFDFTTEPYTVPFDGVGALIVFEHSAKDGSRINLVEIPLRMTR